MEQSVAGGEIFETILTNPISVFMTHMPNYCCDRLAPYLFESLINFVKCFTNLQLISTEPVKLANKYFDLFPDERKPLWSNPCKDKRHIEIYSQNKSCDQLPNTLVVGPQKTGSTALHAFLKLHPNIVSNEDSPETFEELQFFNNDKYYLNGLDWYKQFFPSNTSMTNVVFEKSATYFDADIAPQRAHRLLPSGKIGRKFMYKVQLLCNKDMSLSKNPLICYLLNHIYLLQFLFCVLESIENGHDLGLGFRQFKLSLVSIVAAGC